MAVLLEDIVNSLEHLLKLISKTREEQSYVDPTLDPVLLVPGIAGSILNAVDDKTGKTERVWVRILGADHEFRDKLWSSFDPATGKTVTLDADTHIEVPQDRYGLYAIDMLDPDMVIGGDCVYYFHDMIVEFIKWGYQEGTTLFGFGYDFRQSNRFQGTLDCLASKLGVYLQRIWGKKNKHNQSFYGWPSDKMFYEPAYQCAPGYINSAFLNGTSFVKGWEQNFFISKWSMQQLLLECPSIYELMACLDFEWEHTPLLEIWRQRYDSEGNSTIMLESYPPEEAVPIYMEALSINKISYNGTDMSVPFNVEILKWANETRKLLSSAEVPNQIKFYNIYGMNYETPHCVCYGGSEAPVSDLQALPTLQAKYTYVDGDGTVPLESAKADGLRAEARVGVPGDHRGILCDRHVFRILKHWLKADHDPFYNPVNDYVILPTAFDVESIKTKGGMQITSLREEWEIVGDDQDGKENEAESEPLVGSIDVCQVGGDNRVQEEAHATVVVQPRADGKKRVELNAYNML